VAQLFSLGRKTRMDINDTFLVKAITAFLVPVVLSGICYFLVSEAARRFSSTPRGIYFRRLFYMLIVVAIWFLLYPFFGFSAFIGNGADPHNAEREASWMAAQLGRSYGIYAIWAWLLIALIDRPKLRFSFTIEVRQKS
jgi:hypothetical protein